MIDKMGGGLRYVPTVARRAHPAALPDRFEAVFERAKALLAVHRQLRDESRIKGLEYDVRPQLPADVLGVYVLLPTGSS